MFKPEEIANIILHVVFISSFLGIFFFTYASKVEESIAKAQISFLVSQMGTNLNLLPNVTKAEIKKSLDGVNLNMQEQDDAVEESNKKLLKLAFTVIGVTLLVGLAVVFLMSRKYGFSFMHLLKENLYILVFIALTEYCFLTFLAQKFISIDPNYVKRKLATVLQESVPASTNLQSLNSLEESGINAISEMTSEVPESIQSEIAHGLNNPLLRQYIPDYANDETVQDTLKKIVSNY